MPTSRKGAGGTTCVPTPTSTACGTEGGTIGVATRMESTGPSFTEAHTLSRRSP